MENKMLKFEMYKENNRWFFDDQLMDIRHEEMVLGADKLLNYHAKNKNKLTIFVSDNEIDSYVCHLVYDKPGTDEEGLMGTWYTDTITGQKAWLCPTLEVYFNPVPKEIWISLAI